MLLAWAGNPNEGDKEKVAASIKRFGFIAPICVWTSKGRMVAGHTRLQAFFLLLDRDASFIPRGAPGPGLVPVRFHEFESEAEADAYALADNQLERLSHTDDAKLAAALERIRKAAPELPKIAGFDGKALEAIRARARHVSFTAHDKDPKVPPAPALPKCPTCGRFLAPGAEVPTEEPQRTGNASKSLASKRGKPSKDKRARDLDGRAPAPGARAT
jgi:hypothetical protein